MAASEKVPWEKRVYEGQILPFGLRLAGTLNRRSSNAWKFQKFFIPAPGNDKEIILVEIKTRLLREGEAGDLIEEIETGKKAKRKRVSLK